MSKFDLIKIFLMFAVWRTTIFAIAFISPAVLPNFAGSFPYYQQLIVTKLPHFVWAFANFDGVHYLGIARDGYVNDFTQAFFPLYPRLINIIDSGTISYLLISALFISNISFFIGLIFFFKLISENYNKNIAYWSILFLLAFPTSFYFGAVYTEGLFFALIMISFYLAHKNRVLLASIIGIFASATRFIGIFLAPSIFIIKNIKYRYTVLLIPIGLVFYMVFLYLKFNSALLFLSSQEIFGQGRSSTQIVLPPQVLYRYLKIIVTSSGLPLLNAIFELVCTTFAFSLLIIKYKSIKKEWLVFSLFSLITPTLTGTFSSMPRYVLLAFPIFVVLASVESPLIKYSISVVFLLVLFVTVTLFTQGYWVA